jgi:hypothetical protein
MDTRYDNKDGKWARKGEKITERNKEKNKQKANKKTGARRENCVTVFYRFKGSHLCLLGCGIL